MKNKSIIEQLTQSDLFKEGPVVVFIWKNEANWPVEAVSQNIEILYGYKSEEYTNGSLQYAKQIHPDDLQQVVQEVSEASKNSDKKSFEHEPYRYLDKFGKYHWVKDSTIIVRNETQEITHFIGYLTDISKEIELKKETNTLKERLSLAWEGSNDGIWDWLIDKDEVYFSPRWKSMLGFSDDDFPNESKHFFDLLHKDDRHEVINSLKLHWSNPQKYSYKKEARLRCKDGTYKWILIRGKAILNDDGTPHRMVGSNTDISLQKHYLEKLSNSEILKQNILCTIPQLIWLKDTNGVYLACNPEFERFFGAKEKDIIGKTDYDFVDKKLADFFREHDKKAMQNDKHTINDEWIKYADDGHSALLETVKTPLRDKDGKVIGVLGISHDITQRQKREKKLESLTKDQSTLLSLFEKGDAVLFKWINSENWPVEFVSNSVSKLIGYTAEEFINSKIKYAQCIHNDDIKRIGEDVKEAIAQKSDFFKHEPYRIITKDNQIKWVLDYTATLKDSNGIITHFIGYIIDVTQRKNTSMIKELKHNLSEMLYKNTKDELLRYALDYAEMITQSEIGFYHFIEDNEENASLQVWSTNTLENMCFMEGHSTHYPINQAGIWVDCVHKRSSVIYNDYQSVKHKKGLPEGHAPLYRFLSVPVFRNGKIVAIVGVGNKHTDYSQNDTEVVELIADTAYDMYERQHAEERIEYMAYYDTLTGLPNRTLFTDRLNQAIALTDRNNKLTAVCFIDLDNFKPVNDRYGHHVGDKLLESFSHRTQKELRTGDTMARLGGDEFALVLTQLSSKDELTIILQRILESTNSTFDIDEYRIHISCSIGATIYPIDNSDADTLLRHADHSMYKAKSDGRSAYKLYDYIQNEYLQKNRQLINDFNSAIHNDELILHYQPKISLQDGEILGFEALIRWQHPKRGLLFPGDFLHIIENTPLELSLGEWVISNALKQLHKWHNDNKKVTLSVNISPRQIQLLGFVDFLTNSLKQYPKDMAKFFELEILEVAAIDDMDKVSQVMNGCKNLDINFSLDDFGTGYSSLTYFHRLPIDILKIDQNFVRDMLSKSKDLDIIEGVLKMAHTMKRPVVAEGVESIEIGLMLLNLGCKYAQGYGIAKPMPVENIDKWIKSWEDENIWKHLNEKTTKDLKHYDINAIKFGHVQWIEKLRIYLDKKDEAYLPEIDENKCQFGKWYKGAGYTRYSDKESYPFIQGKHHIVHNTARKIYKLINESEHKKAYELFEKLTSQSKEMLKLLDTLSK